MNAVYSLSCLFLMLASFLLSVYFTKKLLLKICNLEMEMVKVWVGITAFYLRFCESYPLGVRKDTF